MLRRRAYVRLSIALAFTSVALLMTSIYGQSPAIQPGAPDKEVVAAQGPRSSNPEKKVGPTQPGDLENEVAAIKAENAAVREQLRKMEEQQKALLELVDGLRRKLDGIPEPPRTAPEPGQVQPAESPIPSTAADTSAPSTPVSVPAKSPDDDRYQDGIVLWQNSEDTKVPFLLRFNVNTQVRYLNTLSSDDTFTDHLGVVRQVQKRNDITVNRTMFILGGYIFDKRLRFSSTVWTSAGAASIVVAGNIGWQFNKALTITGGYNGVPGSRSLVNTFTFFYLNR